MYILDTNAYSALVKNVGPVTDVVFTEPELAITLPSIAELRYGFAHGSQEQENENRLLGFLAQPNIQILHPSLETTEHYAIIQEYCTQHGRVLSQNDIWIAAIVRESSHTLLTFDKDFSAVRELLGGRVKLLSMGLH
jgi:predicted nucleic acid-binding protein